MLSLRLAVDRMKISSFQTRDDQVYESAAGNMACKQQAEDVGNVINVHRDALKTLFPVPPKRAARRSTRTTLVSSAFVVTMLAGLWWLDPAYRSEHFSTDVGARSTVELADGSRLILDTATKLTVNWHLRSRRVTLKEGRTRFEVARAVWRPFTIDAGDAQVRVVGTQFDVWRAKDVARISVYEGRVAVWRNNSDAKPLMLVAGQQTNVQQDAPSDLQAVGIEGDLKGAWKNGTLVFLNTALIDAVAIIQRYRQTPIRIVDRPTEGLTVSGVFNSGNTDQLLDLLPGILPVHVEHKVDGSIELSAR